MGPGLTLAGVEAAVAPKAFEAFAEVCASESLGVDGERVRIALAVDEQLRGCPACCPSSG